MLEGWYPKEDSMEPEWKELHLRAAIFYGEASACGKKVDYKSETTARSAAVALSLTYKKQMEAYPCPWCQGWHIGREMLPKEVAQFA
jgi:hypothetical protein